MKLASHTFLERAFCAHRCGCKAHLPGEQTLETDLASAKGLQFTNHQHPIQFTLQVARWERGNQEQTKTKSNSELTHFQCIKGSSVTAPCNGLWSSCNYIWLSACQEQMQSPIACRKSLMIQSIPLQNRERSPYSQTKEGFFWDKRRDRARWFQILSRHLQLPRYFTQTVLRCFIGHQWSKIHIQLKTTHGFLSLKKSVYKLSAGSHSQNKIHLHLYTTEGNQ